MSVTVVIPCYKVRDKILDVLARMPPVVDTILCVDDACPDGSGNYIEQSCRDPRVRVLFHQKNQGVGGAMITGYCAALAAGAAIIVKIDGDGQMAPELIPSFIAPIRKGLCDYTKGNRFFQPEDLHGMPLVRIFGNGVLSFMTKLSSGYWDIFDPTNGYTAIHARALQTIPLEKLARSYFFESDMLFRLNIARAVVRDIPMRAVYGDEESGLKISHILGPFLKGHARNFAKRIVYNYFLRDFSAASLELVCGILFLLFGLIFGAVKWHVSRITGLPASAGTVMLSALPVLLGFQMLLSFLQFDVQTTPRVPLHADRQD